MRGYANGTDCSRQTSLLHPGAQFLNREARRSSWEATEACGIPLREARFRKKKKPERESRPFPHMYLCFLKKTYRFFFFFAVFFVFFLAAFFLGFDFFAFFFGAAFFFAAFLAGFFAAGLVAGFGAGASSSGSSPTITSSSSSVSTISSVSPASSSSSSSRDSSLSSSKLSFSKSIPSSPRGIFGSHSQKGPVGRCSGRSYLKFHPVLEPLLPYSPCVVKHSAVFLARDCRNFGERGANKPQQETLRDPCPPVIHSQETT